MDDFGFEMYYVNQLRRHDAGGMTLGDPTLRLKVRDTRLPFPLPSWPYESGNLRPGQGALEHRQATCASECTRSLQEPITIFGSNLHMHTLGQKMYTEHYDAAGKHDSSYSG